MSAPGLDPDPRYVAPDDDSFMPSAEYVEAYDDGWTDRDHLSSLNLRAFGLGVMVGLILGVALVASSDPRSPTNSTISPSRDLSGLRADTSGSPPTGAPLDPALVPAALHGDDRQVGAPSSPAAGGPRVSQPTDPRASARAAYASATEPASIAGARP